MGSLRIQVLSKSKHSSVYPAYSRLTGPTAPINATGDVLALVPAVGAADTLDTESTWMTRSVWSTSPFHLSPTCGMCKSHIGDLLPVSGDNQFLNGAVIQGPILRRCHPEHTSGPPKRKASTHTHNCVHARHAWRNQARFVQEGGPRRLSVQLI